MFLGVSLVPITVPVLINSPEGGHHTRALVDSGPVGNYISLLSALKSRIPLQVFLTLSRCLGLAERPSLEAR